MTNTIRQVRSRRGISAALLADRIGVTRQTIHAIESGSYAPNTTVTLRLARELGVAVEDLFQLDEVGQDLQQTVHIAGAGTHAGGPLRLGRVDGKLIGVPWMPEAFAVPPWDATALTDAIDGQVTAALTEGRGTAENRLLIAGCDPAVSVLAAHLQRIADFDLIAVPSSSQRALKQMEEGLVHLAGTHLNKSVATIPRGCRVFTLAEWEVGFVVAKGNPKDIRGFAELAAPGLRIVNREVGSGSRALLDSGLAEIGIEGKTVEGYDQIAPGHLAAATAVLRGTADCCVAPAVAARVFGLTFVPLASERYNLVVPEQRLDLPSIRALLDVLQRGSFRRELAARAGYDTAAAGAEIS